ncbi:MAG TPA: acetylhydrolase, partial [Thermoanaerobaculia bacterium]
MRAPSACLALLLLAAPAAVLAKPAPAPAASLKTYKADPGPSVVTATLLDWHDASRNRPVPVKIYAPATGAGPFPVIVFSHGLGGSRNGYEYLGRHWASWGYVSVHVEHLGSDTTAITKGGRLLKNLKEAAGDPRNAVARPLDVRFVLDQLEKLNQGGSPLSHRLDLTRVGMAGHSFGSWTAMAVAGQRFGQETNFTEPRFKAAIAMSTPVPKQRDYDRVYRDDVHIPILHMTGTEDDSPIGDTKAAERRVPFDHIQAPGQYLVIFQGGDHMIFAGQRRQASQGEKDPRFRDLILQGTTAFWDAYLKGDAAAKSWLSR